MDQLEKITKAIKLVDKKLLTCESLIATNKSSTDASKADNIIVEVSVDLDFLFATLDQVTGTYVKTRRKECANELNKLSSRMESIRMKLLN